MPKDLTPLVDAWLTAETKLVVWDFDQTVLRCHAFAQGVEPSHVSARWKKDVADLETFRSFVGAAQRRGIALGVASFGRSDVIAAYMKQIAPGAFSDASIVTPSSLGSATARLFGLSKYSDGMSVEDGKPQMLQLLCKRNNVSPGNVLFFDDDADNVARCKAAGFVRSFHTPAGFSARTLEKLAGESRCAIL